MLADRPDRSTVTGRFAQRCRRWTSSRRPARRARGRGRGARERCCDRLVDEGFELEELKSGGQGGPAGAAAGRARAGRCATRPTSSRSEPDCQPRMMLADPAACSGCPRPARTTACSATRTSRRPSRPGCSSTPASARRRSPRSPGCSARAWRGWRPRSPPRSWTTFLEAGRQRGRGGAALRLGWPSS